MDYMDPDVLKKADKLNLSLSPAPCFHLNIQLLLWYFMESSE